MIGPWRANAILREELKEARAEIRRLTDVIISMKPAGFAADPPPYPAAPEGDQEDAGDLDQQIRDAIRQRAEDESEVEEFEAYARGMLGEGKTPGDVAHRILEGLDPMAYMRE